MRRPLVSITSAFVLLVASGASAATRCVTPSPTTTCPYSTIQAGVTAAVGGDIVKVSPGVYYEAVTVPAGKDALQIIGTSKLNTILDPDVPNAGSNGITVQSNGVKIANLGIRNGTAWGIYVTANNVVITGVRIVGVHNAATGGAVRVLGNGAQILTNEIRGCALEGMWLTGNNGIFKANTVTQVQRGGIVAIGDQNQVLSNKVSNAATVTPYAAVYVAASLSGKNVVSFNTIENAGYGGSNAIGLYVSDPEPIVQGNRLIWAGEVQITCLNCNGGKVIYNSQVGSTARGFMIASYPVASPAARLLVQGNKAGATFGHALDIAGSTGLAQGDGIQVLQNTAAETVSGRHCFRVTGSGHTLTTNGVLNCGGAGFYSQGDNFLFTSNVVKNSSSSGFVVDGDNGGGPAHFGVTLNTNKTTGSVGQGFALYDGTNGGFFPIGTTGSGNTGTLNRQDFCNEGAATTIGTFATTSTTCDIRP